MTFYAHTLKTSKGENLFTFVKFAGERLTALEFAKRTGAMHQNGEKLPLSLLNDYLYCPRRAEVSFPQFCLQVAGAVQHAQQPEPIRQHFVKDQVLAESAHMPRPRFWRAQVRSHATQAPASAPANPRWL